MDDVHMPTVPSGSRDTGTNGTTPVTFQELVAEKERLEMEITALSQVLDSVCVEDDS
jgi:26S proteasome non-ATPase regulatory subunit 9